MLYRYMDPLGQTSGRSSQEVGQKKVCPEHPGFRVSGLGFRV